MAERIHQMSARMAAGDADAIDAFYREHFDWMYQHARRVTHRDESFCLDIVQNAVLRIMRTVKAVHTETHFRGWLRLVVQTSAFDLLRSETRRRNREAMAGGPPLQVETDSLQLDWLREQISRLDPDLIHLIELRFNRSWKLATIAESVGLSIGAVDGRLRRAFRTMKLSAEDPPQPLDEMLKPIAAPTPATPQALAVVAEIETPLESPPPPLLELDTPATVFDDQPAIEDEAGAYDDRL